MTTIQRFGLFTLTSALAFATGQPADASTYRHLDRLAVQLEQQATALQEEFAIHFRHARHYGHLRSDAIRIAGLARHIHVVAHHRGSLRHLDHDLQRLDRRFHHLEDLVAHIVDDAIHGDGHLDGDASHVRILMQQMSNTLHHLKRDVEQLRRPTCNFYNRPYVHGGHSGYRGHGGARTLVPGVSFNRGGIAFGNGHFQFQVAR